MTSMIAHAHMARAHHVYKHPRGLGMLLHVGTNACMYRTCGTIATGTAQVRLSVVGFVGCGFLVNGQSLRRNLVLPPLWSPRTIL